MNIIISFIAPFLLFLQPAAKNEDVIIRGKVTNANELFVTLNYNPWLRGNPCYDGFRSVGTAVDKNGNFELTLKNITNGAQYNLSFDIEGVNFPLFKGDNVTFTFDAKNFNQTFFATGKGSGKINVMNLEQFKGNMGHSEKWTPEQFAACKDSLIAARLLLLDEIYNKKTDSGIIAVEKNSEVIKRIITGSPLNTEEYTFLKSQVVMNQFLTLDFGNVKIDSTSAYFKHFSAKEYDKVANIDYNVNQYMVYNILHVEYLKNIQKEKPGITYNQGLELTATGKAFDWMLSYLKNNFTAEIHDKMVVEFLMMNAVGENFNEKDYTYFKENCTSKKYRDYVDKYEAVLKNGINDTKHNLNAEKFTLNAKTFEALMNQHKGEDVLVVFWSAQYAGASVLNNLPILYYLEKQYHIKVINICIGTSHNKKLWASRIINNHWKGEHYFMPSESNETTLKNFSSQKLENFCNGGATYTIIEKNGSIHNNIENPLLLSAGKINTYLHK